MSWSSRAPVITLTTDFGLNDEYVGVMKGVILTRCPEVVPIDLTHSIRAQDVRSAAYIIDASHRYFPAGTIHVIVVDPGVGSGRRIIALQSREQIFLAPDNGVLTLLFSRAEKIFAVTSEDLFLPGRSMTFHGRDIFAPAAAHLACGLSADKLGPPLKVTDLHHLSLPGIQRFPDHLEGSVVYIDHFGNLVTNLDLETVRAFYGNDLTSVRVRVKDLLINSISRSYTTEGNSGPIALFNSRGCLEIAVPMGNASLDLRISTDERVYLVRQA